MTSLIAENWLLLLVALIIGLATAYWVWGQTAARRGDDRFDADDGLLERAGAAVPASAVTDERAEVRARDLPEGDHVVVEPAGDGVLVTPVEDEAAPRPDPLVSAPARETADLEPATDVIAPAPVRESRADAVVPSARPAGTPNIAPAEGPPDNLRLIKGIGPKLAALLTELGVTRFDQIAAWREAEIAEVDPYLDSFSGRITRDAWIDQAKYLARDDIAGFEAKYGKL